MKRILSMLALLPLAATALEINTASQAQLEQLPGLGVATAECILQARAERPFADWNDLGARVSGLRGKRAAQLDRQGLDANGKALADWQQRK